MQKENKAEIPDVPSWVKEHFEAVKTPSPNPTQSAPSKDSQTLIYAQGEAHLALANIQAFRMDEKKVKKERHRLAYNLMILGEFSAAESYADDPELQDKIKLYKKAVHENDEKFCKCADGESQLANAKIPLSRFRTLQRIYNPKLKKFVDVKQCTKCGFTNATDVLTPTESTIVNKLANAKEGDSDEKVFK